MIPIIVARIELYLESFSGRDILKGNLRQKRPCDWKTEGIL